MPSLSPNKVLDNVINIGDILAKREIKDLLELSESGTHDFFQSLQGGNTLAEALRKIEITSASQIDLDTWPKLRKWRDRYFPNNRKSK